MKKTKYFEPILLVSPKIDKRQSNDNSDVIKYLKDKNYDYIEYNNNLNMKDLNPDYVFYSTPFFSLYPKDLWFGKINKICKICYFPYGYTIYDKKSINLYVNKDIQKNFSYIFIENEFVYENYKDIIDKRFFITGHPKVNYLLNNKNTYTNNKIKNILWCPRWIPHNSNFDKYYNYFLRLADNKNVNIIVRFHPLDKNNKRIFFFRIRKYKKNIKIDNNGSYIDLFEKTDIFISDLSTMVPEFFPTGKPIIYTEHNNNIPNNFMNELEKGLYKINNEEKLNKIILKLIDNKDELKDNRKDIIDKYYNKYNASENICNILK